MKKNIGILDRWIRMSISFVIMLLYYFDVIGGTVAMVLLIVSLVLLLTSLFSFCSLYKIFGINTCKKD